jgi:hypothetical protein
MKCNITSKTKKLTRPWVLGALDLRAWCRSRELEEGLVQGGGVDEMRPYLEAAGRAWCIRWVYQQVGEMCGGETAGSIFTVV